MALTSRTESRSIRVTSSNGESDALISSATYSPRSVNITFEICDAVYCAAHGVEVEAAMTSFLATLNALLAEAGIPEVHAV